MTSGPYILAITGGSGAGKTTLARALVSKFSSLRTIIISEDHYYQDNAAQPGFDPACFNFDAPETRDHALLAAQLEQLHTFAPIDMPQYDFHAHRRLLTTTAVEPADLIIVEGTLVLHDSRVREACNYGVYLDIPDDIRLKRRIQRDVAERGRDLASILRQYEMTVKPMHDLHVHPSRLYADSIVTADQTGAIDGIATLIEAYFGERVMIKD